MLLRLLRDTYTRRSTVGRLSVDGLVVCDTLEDRVRADPDPTTAANEAKVPGRTAIPAGRYLVVLDRPRRAIWSPDPSGLLPHLLDVPGFTGIYVHALNEPGETLGCIGVGRRDPARADWVGASRTALAAVLPRVAEGLRTPGGLWLIVADGGRPPTGEDADAGGEA